MSTQFIVVILWRVVHSSEDDRIDSTRLTVRSNDEPLGSLTCGSSLKLKVDLMKVQIMEMRGVP